MINLSQQMQFLVVQALESRSAQCCTSSNGKRGFLLANLTIKMRQEITVSPQIVTEIPSYVSNQEVNKK
jgi:hypothetical protein